jgi:predicted Zn-dependent peptidase
MRPRSLALTLSLALATGSFAALAQTASPQNSPRVVPPPPTPFALPAYKRVVLPSGMTLLLLEKHQVPLISVTGLFRSGSTADPTGKAGLASLTAQLLRKGTAKQDAAAISEQLDSLGIIYSASASLDSTSVSTNFLAKDQTEALELFRQVLLQPSFPESEVSKLLAQSQDAVRANKDNAQAVVQNYYRHFLYGDTPYGRPTAGDEVSLKSITRDDILSFYRANYTPGNFILAVAGDFDSAAMQASLTKLFASWSGKAPAPVTLPAIKPVPGRRLLLVDKPDATQSYFIMGNVGIDALNPDRGELNVVNTLFGGRFTSLFNTELRIKSGYSYGASSSFTELRGAGPFIMATYTKNATTGPAMDKTLEVLHTGRTVGFTADKLTSAKNTIAGELPPRFETAGQLSAAMARNELYGITRDQFNANLTNLQKTTVADEKRLLNTYYPSEDNLVIVVVGKASEIEPLMSKYTTNITRKKITDPGY